MCAPQKADMISSMTPKEEVAKPKKKKGDVLTDGEVLLGFVALSSLIVYKVVYMGPLMDGEGEIVTILAALLVMSFLHLSRKTSSQDETQPERKSKDKKAYSSKDKLTAGEVKFGFALLVILLVLPLVLFNTPTTTTQYDVDAVSKKTEETVARELIPDAREVIPEDKDVIPKAAEVIPETEEVVREAEEGIPEAEEIISEAEEVISEAEGVITEEADKVEEIQDDSLDVAKVLLKNMQSGLRNHYVVMSFKITEAEQRILNETKNCKEFLQGKSNTGCSLENAQVKKWTAKKTNETEQNEKEKQAACERYLAGDSNTDCSLEQAQEHINKLRKWLSTAEKDMEKTFETEHDECLYYFAGKENSSCPLSDMDKELLQQNEWLNIKLKDIEDHFGIGDWINYFQRKEENDILRNKAPAQIHDLFSDNVAGKPERTETKRTVATEKKSSGSDSAEQAAVTTGQSKIEVEAGDMIKEELNESVSKTDSVEEAQTGKSTHETIEPAETSKREDAVAGEPAEASEKEVMVDDFSADVEHPESSSSSSTTDQAMKDSMLEEDTNDGVTEIVPRETERLVVEAKEKYLPSKQDAKKENKIAATIRRSVYFFGAGDVVDSFFARD